MFIQVNSSSLSVTCWKKRSAVAEERRGRHPRQAHRTRSAQSPFLSLPRVAHLEMWIKLRRFWFSSEDIVWPPPPSCCLTCALLIVQRLKENRARRRQLLVSPPCQWKLWPLRIFDLTGIRAPVMLFCVFYTNSSLLFALCVVRILLLS